MKAPNKNPMWFMALFIFLAMNMSWVQEAFMPQTLDFSSNAEQEIKCDPNNSVCRGVRVERRQVGRDEQTVRVNVNAQKTQGTLDGFDALVGENRRQDGYQVTVEAEDCPVGQCRRTRFVPMSLIKNGADLQRVADELARTVSDSAFQAKLRDEEFRKNEAAWTRSVNECRARWKNSARPQEGIITTSQTSQERRECLVSRLESGDIGRESARSYFTRLLAPDLKRMVEGNDADRSAAMDLLTRLKESDLEGVSSVVDAMIGYATYAQRMNANLVKYANQEITLPLLQQLLQQDITNAQYDFRNRGLLGGGANSQDTSDWLNRLGTRANYIMSHTDQAIRDIRSGANGSPVLSGSDSFVMRSDILDNRLTAVYGRVRGGPNDVNLVSTRPPSNLIITTPRQRSF